MFQQILSIWPTLWAIFGINAGLFLNFFKNHFVEEEKLYNIYEIQHGTWKIDWMAADILETIDQLFTRKMTSHE